MLPILFPLLGGTVTSDGGKLLVTTHVAQLNDDGSIQRPKGTQYTLMEIGCSDWDTLDQSGNGQEESELDRHPFGFLIAFEPLLDKYAVLLARGTQRYHGKMHDLAVPLGHHHQRGVVLPLAVSAEGGAANFTVHKRAGCSSLLEAQKATTAGWGKLCEPVLERRTLESIPLARAIELAGP